MAPEEAPTTDAAARNGGSGLSDVWNRLEGICSKLWEDDHKSAVTLQALIEEFRVEVDRAERNVVSLRTSLDHQRKTIEKEISAIFQDQIGDLNRQRQNEQARTQALEKTLEADRKRIEALQADKLELEKRLSALRATMNSQRDEVEKEVFTTFEAQIADLEQVMAVVKEQAKIAQDAIVEERKRCQALLEEKRGLESDLLKVQEEAVSSESTRDNSRAKRMQEVLQDLRKKEETLEETWSARRRELEREYQERAALLETAYLEKEKTLEKSHRGFRTELDEKESRLTRLEDELLTQQHDNQKYRHQLEETWRKKRLELDEIKIAMQREVKELIQRYKTKND